MCVIIHKPQDVVIPESVLKQCWKSNPHGAGYMYAQDGKLFVPKGYMTFDAFLESYSKISSAQEVVVHFRLASCGKVVPEQTHPMLINENLAFCHNGHMINKTIREGVNSHKSDTIVFLEKILMQLPNAFLNNSAIRELLTEYLDSSVLFFMDNEGNVDVLGDQDGTYFQDGCRFSNDWWTNLGQYREDDDDVYVGDYQTDGDNCKKCGGFGLTDEGKSCKSCDGTGIRRKDNAD